MSRTPFELIPKGYVKPAKKLSDASAAPPKPAESALVDIVFLHGVTGDHIDTWCHANGQFWPEWLAADVPEANVFCAGYDSSLFSDLVEGSGSGLSDRATTLLDRIIAKTDPKRPVIFITHSLGGLVVKKLIEKAKAASNLKKKAFAARVAGVVFIATPHRGASLAKIATSILNKTLSKATKELAHGSDPLIDLADGFSAWAVEAKVPVAAYYETLKYNGVLVVDKMSADPAVHGCDPTAVEDNHVNITKLSDRDTALYESILMFIKDIVSSLAGAGGQIPSGGLGDDAAGDYQAFTTQAPADRRTLAEKLEAAGRSAEVARAEQLKERFSMALQRNVAQPSAVDQYSRLMAQVESRFSRHVSPQIATGMQSSEIDGLIQARVIDDGVIFQAAIGEQATARTVESALYYLAGNCHIRWDNG